MGQNRVIEFISKQLLPFWTVRTSSTSSWNSMLTWRTTLLFFWPISAARKGHLEATALPQDGTGWPAGCLDSPPCLRPASEQKRFLTLDLNSYYIIYYINWDTSLDVM